MLWLHSLAHIYIPTQIFANHGDQRKWIIEEILSSLIKLSDTKQKAGQFRYVRALKPALSLLSIIIHSLRDGRSIRTVSALLLQLVQTSAHDVRLEARKLGKARVQQLALRRQESISGPIHGGMREDEPFLDQQDHEVRISMRSRKHEDDNLSLGNSSVHLWIRLCDGIR
jgi:cohesin loading factor subunit SCC2